LRWGILRSAAAKNTKACVENNPGKIILSKEEMEQAYRIKASFDNQIKAEPFLGRLLDGVKELSFVWEDPKTKILCKVRPDVLTKHGAIVDIKTTRNAAFDFFQKQLVDLGYFISAAYYLRGVTETINQIGPSPLVPVLPKAFVFIVIETEAPYAVAYYHLAPKALEMGDIFVERALDTYAEAVSTEKWEGYPKRLIEMDLPNWALYKFNYVGGNP
jgi:hypothetical protein